MLSLHITVTGRDSAAGTASQPLASIAGARDRLRELRHADTLPDGAVVTLHAGAYRVGETLRLEAGDGGTAEAPVVFRAAPGEAVTLTGGIEVPAESLRPLAEPSIIARLPEAAREHVRVADLAALGCSRTTCSAGTGRRRLPIWRFPSAPGPRRTRLAPGSGSSASVPGSRNETTSPDWSDPQQGE